MEDRLVSQKHWDKHYENIKMYIAHKKDPTRILIEQYIEKGKGTCFEIGCFPGRYLTIFGDLGYELHGIDLTEKVNRVMPDWFKKNNYRVGKFEKSDFMEYKSTMKYDIVCSFGFIEHFKNWEEILVKHTEFIKDTGYLVITTPNFKGFIQNKLHKLLDNENYKRHYIPSMSPKKWGEILREAGFDIVYNGYFGKFDFWIERENMREISRFLLKLIIKPFRFILPPHKKSYSPFCGLIARRG